MTKEQIRTRIVDIIIIVMGTAIYAVTFNLFLEPYKISPGGVSGIALIINSLTGVLSIGSLIIIINIPLFLLAWRKLGRKFVLLSLVGTLSSSVLIDLLSLILPAIETEPLLAAIYGGVLAGIGLGLVFSRGASTGGSDIAIKLLKLKFRGVSMGKLMLAIDCAIAVASAIAFKDINRMLYAIITLYISSIVLDGVIYGFDFSKAAYIISDNPEQIACDIESRLMRGVTVLDGRGHYSGNEKQVLLAVVKNQQVADLKDIVKSADPNAFLIVTEAHRVVGEGFDSYDSDL